MHFVNHQVKIPSKMKNSLTTKVADALAEIAPNELPCLANA
jgi:hypothetical protein